jgi:hypothetical protein
MALCPYCQSELGDDFGLVECSSCHKVSFIEIEGQVSAPEPMPVVEDSREDDTIPDKTVANEVSFADVFAEEDGDMGDLTQALPIEEGEGSLVDQPQDAYETEEAAPEPTLAAAETLLGPLEDESSSLLNDSMKPQASSGNLRYQLRIHGIDSADARSEIYDIVTDKRFLWDAESLMKSIKKGELIIRDVSAVKAALLVNRLRSVAVDVEWEQHAN